MITYVKDGIYYGLIAGKGGPDIIHRGERFEQQIPPKKWNELVKGGLRQRGFTPSGFECPRCDGPVIVKESNQLCRCSKLANKPGHELATIKEWTAWQDNYDRQLADPMPDDYWQESIPNSDGGPPHKGELLSPPGKRWLARKFGLPSNLEISDDGHTMRLPGVGGALTISPKGNLSAVNLPDDESGGFELFLVAQQIMIARESRPQMTLVIGDDDFYVWPPFTDHRRIRPLPFSCSRCGKRVMHAPVLEGQLLVCFCLQAAYPQGSEKNPPRSRIEWDKLRIGAAAEVARTSAQTAGVEN